MSLQPLKRVAGNMFGREDAIRSMRCSKKPVGCERLITKEEFGSWDDLSRREYRQSGWCRECQDGFFGQCEEDGCTHWDEMGCACTCRSPCCEADIGVGVITCGSQHCSVHRSGA